MNANHYDDEDDDDDVEDPTRLFPSQPLDSNISKVANSSPACSVYYYRHYFCIIIFRCDCISKHLPLSVGQ